MPLIIAAAASRPFTAIATATFTADVADEYTFKQNK